MTLFFFGGSFFIQKHDFIWTRIRLRGLHKGEKMRKKEEKKKKKEEKRREEKEEKDKTRENGGRHVWSYVEGCCEVTHASVD